MKLKQEHHSLSQRKTTQNTNRTQLEHKAAIQYNDTTSAASCISGFSARTKRSNNKKPAIVLQVIRNEIIFGQFIVAIIACSNF